MRAVNLIPAEQRGGAPVGAGQSEGGAYALLGLLAGLAVLALLYGVAHHQISSRKAEAASVSAQAQQAQTAAQTLAPYTSFIAMREARLQAVSTLINTRFDWAHVFHEFGRVLPSGISISSLDGTVAAGTPAAAAPATAATSTAATSSAAVASATPPGSVPTFTLGGCATSQREVALMLARLRLMDGVSNVTLQSSTKGASSPGGATSGSCPENAPAFTAQIAFAPLPASAAKLSPTATVAQTGTAAAGAAPTPTTSGATAR